MSVVKPIGKAEVAKPYSIVNLPPLIIGGAVFNTQYSSDPAQLPIYEILNKAFSYGLNAIDTSPYYGPSEELLGQALEKVSFSRDQYYICTKAGRIRLNEFDYSPDSVRKSVMRSMQRLGTEYLDLVYMHDIEFVEKEQIYEALKELRKLKDEGHIRAFGASGYPVDLLYEIAQGCQHNPEVGSLDAVMSYSNGCIQNTRFFEYYDKFLECGVKKLMNGSILSMSLLRSGPTHSFHPAQPELKQKVYEIGQELRARHGLELADVATRFALKKWMFDTNNANDANGSEHQWNQKTSTVLGVSNVYELDVAISSYWQVKTNHDNINGRDSEIFREVERSLGKYHNMVWESGIKQK